SVGRQGLRRIRGDRRPALHRQRRDGCLERARRQAAQHAADAAKGLAGDPRGGGGALNPTIVIPGRGAAASPESITTIESMDSGPVASGRQLPTEGASRNDDVNCSIVLIPCAAIQPESI